MNNSTMLNQIREGATVYAADGDKLGKVIAVRADHIVVEKGFFFPTDYYIPTSAIASAAGDDVYLTVTKDHALTSRWNEVPADADWGTTATPADYAERFDVDTAQSDTLRVPVHEEELTATTRPVARGQVRIEKDVVAEERTLDVPVTEERVTVTRRTVDRAGVAEADAFTEGTIEVPVRGEEVDVQKRVRVAEEVEIGKQAVQRTETVGGTVRREEVHVEDETTGMPYAVDGTQTDSSRKA